MKGHKAHHHAKGGSVNKGVDSAAADVATKVPRRNIAPKIFDEAEARKSGGKVKGEKAMAHAGRKPRKSGGRTGSEANPFTSAAKGTPPKGHSVDKVTMGKDL
jgi:hypothetical protein